MGHENFACKPICEIHILWKGYQKGNCHIILETKIESARFSEQENCYSEFYIGFTYKYFSISR